MKKGLKYTLVSLGSLVVLAGIGLGIMYVVSPYKVKRWVGIASSYSDVFVDRLKGQPYTHGGYDGIDVSKHNGVIKWKEIAKNKRIKFVYIRATHGKGYVDRHYRRNIRLARKYGLKVGSYHLMSAGSSVTALPGFPKDGEEGRAGLDSCIGCGGERHPGKMEGTTAAG